MKKTTGTVTLKQDKKTGRVIGVRSMDDQIVDEFKKKAAANKTSKKTTKK